MEQLKILGQLNSVINNLADIYVVPALTQTTISSIVICNQTSGFILFSISISKNGSADDPKQYIYFNTPLDINDSFVATIGISLSAGDIIRFKASDNNISINIFGVEIS